MDVAAAPPDRHAHRRSFRPSPGDIGGDPQRGIAGSCGGNGGNTGDLALFRSGGADGVGGNGDPTFTISGGNAGAGAR